MSKKIAKNKGPTFIDVKGCSEAFNLMIQNKNEIAVKESDLWFMCCAVQLACRHPGFMGSTRQYAENAAREIFNLITARYPKLKVIAEKGWNPDFDV